MDCGYDVTFSAEIDSRFQCPVCLHVLRDAVQTACGHRFCKSCITRVNTKNTVLTCPVDKTFSRMDQMFPDIATQREILSLVAKCNHADEGCSWQGELRGLDEHLTVCEIVPIICTNECGFSTKRGQLEDHFKTCPCRKINCQHCTKLVAHNKLESHIKKCPKVPMTCSLCRETTVLREKMTEHVSPELGKCPKVVIPCPHQSVGCEFKAERYLVAEHLQGPEALQEHMKLAVTVLQEHSTLIKELKDKLGALSEKSEKMFPLLVLTDRHHAQISNELRERNVTGKLHWKVKIGQQRNRCTSYMSHVFYTGCPGYKVQLSLETEGPREGNNRYTSLSLCLLPGDYDNDVIFPFNATCLVTLYDQENNPAQPRQNQTHQMVIREVPRNHSRAGHFVDRLYRREISKYVKRQELLGSGSRYIKHNALHFEVTVIHAFYPSIEDSPSSNTSLMAHGSFVVHTPCWTPSTSDTSTAQVPTTPVMRVATVAIGN